VHCSAWEYTSICEAKEIIICEMYDEQQNVCDCPNELGELLNSKITLQIAVIRSPSQRQYALMIMEVKYNTK
jgi:hypothetical protein